MTQRHALGWLVLGALAAIVWLAVPFATGLLLGTLIAFTLEPVYQRLVRRTGRPLLASLLIVMTSAVVIIGALAGFVSLFITRAVQFSNTVREALQPGGTLNASLAAVTVWFGRFGISTASITSRLEAGAGEIASRSAAMAGSLASGTFSVLLGLFFALLAIHVVLRYWDRIVAELVVVSPLKPDYTRLLLDEFRRVGRMTVSGTVLTGVAQGMLAALGFWISGVPQAVFFGITTAIASLIPAVGTLLVWIPAGIYLFAIDHPIRGVIELSWGALVVVGFSDYVVRPRLVGDAAMPTLLVFVALFGGAEALGLAGLIVGPVIMALALAILRLYAREQEGRTVDADATNGG
jgi:predicted PurR-regulated permease PerM